MLIDYLRYEAFAGRFQSFFEGGLQNYVDIEHTTGQHLRFDPNWIDDRWSSYDFSAFVELDNRHGRTMVRALDQIGLRRSSDPLMESGLSLGDKPPTYRYTPTGKYRSDKFPRFEIIIDIDPKHWSKRYFEPMSYEGTPITYRRSAPARANCSSGDRLFDKRGGYGTLCGIFQTRDGRTFGLTCGHVTRDGGEVFLEHPRRFWRFELGFTFSPFGSTRYHTMLGPDITIERLTTKLDAALIECNRRFEILQRTAKIRQAFLKPISSILQEELVHFHGASRQRLMPARISALTIRKSIDLFNDGNLHSVGDLLMLRHHQRMYIVQPVSRPGDSGAAVRGGLSERGPIEVINQCYGMVLGGDEYSAYASHAEFIWAWAGDVLSTTNLDFYF